MDSDGINVGLYDNHNNFVEKYVNIYFYFRQWGNVAWFMRLSVSRITQKCERIVTKLFLGVGVGSVTANSWLDFGIDPDDNADPEIF